jgi:hypothetical protein
LVFKGGDRELKNNVGQKPIDLIDKSKCDESIKKELRMILGKQPLNLSCFAFKQPFEKLEKKPTTVRSYFIIITIAMLFLYLFVMPFEGPRTFAIPLFCLLIVSNIFFILTIKRDPGYIKKSEKISFVKLNQFFQPAYICPKCEIIRSKDSNHCHYCNKCVDRFDHHCPWVDNCIGHGNHNVFMMLIITMWSFLVFTLFVCFKNIDLVVTESLVTEAQSHWLGFLLKALNSHEHTTSIQVIVDVVLIAVITVATVFLMPVSMLLQVQVLNFMEGQTTPERLKAATVSKAGTKSVPMKGKEYAKFILLNLEDNQNIFINKKAAQDFMNHLDSLSQDDNKSNKSQIISEEGSSKKNSVAPGSPQHPESPDSFYNKYKLQKVKSSSSYKYSSDTSKS